MPLGFSFFLGRRLGDLAYYCDYRHRAVAYANSKTAIGEKASPHELRKVVKKFYRHFGQNLIEIFLIPLIDKGYIERYISIEGFEHIEKGFARGKGIVLVGIHEGSWELSNIVCANLGFPFVLFVREQGLPRLNRLLNTYRIEKGCKIIQRPVPVPGAENLGNGAKEQEKMSSWGVKPLIRALKANEAIGMTADQGGKNGILVDFFSKQASMPTGAVRLAYKNDACLIPVFFRRIRGPYTKIIVHPQVEIKKTQDQEHDIFENVQRVVSIFEQDIRKYPEEYLWTYKIWKYGKDRRILILDDGRTGHLRQSEKTAFLLQDVLRDKGISAHSETLKVHFKNTFARSLCSLGGGLSGRFSCQGCLVCLKTCLESTAYEKLIKARADYVISCGSSTAMVNYLISRENTARSIVILRPSFLSLGRFDLVIMPRHDRPPKKRNVIVTDGALNLINEEYLREQGKKLRAESVAAPKALRPSLGLLIGGDTKHGRLKPSTVAALLKQIHFFAEQSDATVFATTSRRTSSEVEEVIKKELRYTARCKFLVIANEKNVGYAVGGIIAVSNFVVVSSESISMISEAASSNRYCIVFKSPVSSRHKKFLGTMVKKGYIYLCETQEVASLLERLWRERPAIRVLDDDAQVKEALRQLL
jgi:lauroyl/myristoyl acyltransferase/mitochondrial fission protein ELM1